MQDIVKPIRIDILHLRQERQTRNNRLCLESLAKKDITKNINIKAFEIVLQVLEMSKSQILDKCSEDACFAKLLALKVSVNASRQGISDEILQINCCNETASKFGIFFDKLHSKQYRPLKNGCIVSAQQIKQENISKNDCLKSFDAKITGRVQGWVFAKVVIGSGGHQDNVFEEASQLCEWVENFGCNEELYVVLIDTDHLPKIQELQKKFAASTYTNLLVGNHITVQEYFIENYSL
jgi:hypothetical protein